MARYALEVVYETLENQEGLDGKQIVEALLPILLRGNEGGEIVVHSIGLYPKQTWYDARQPERTEEENARIRKAAQEALDMLEERSKPGWWLRRLGRR